MFDTVVTPVIVAFCDFFSNFQKKNTKSGNAP